jgi:hypothetical protein
LDSPPDARPEGSPRLRLPKEALWIAAAALPVRAILAASTDLSPDEAYYLCAARAEGVLPPIADHPPLMPWLLRLSDALTFLPVELRVRVWPMALSFLLGIGCIELARRRGADRAGCLLAAWIGSWALLPMTAGFVATPDGPASVASLAALVWAGSTEPAEPRLRARSAAWTLVTGLVLAAGALAKVVVVPIAVVVAILARGRSYAHRTLLLVPLAASFPLLVPSLRFQLHHAFADRPDAWRPAGALASLAEAALVQGLLWSPWVLARGFRAARALPAADIGLLASMSAMVGISALARGVPPEANWWAPAALVVVTGAAIARSPLRRAARAGLLATVVLPTLIAALHVLRPFLPLPPQADPTARLHGWSEGREPVGAAGVGIYGPAAERCVYRGTCEEIDSYFNEMRSKH